MAFMKWDAKYLVEIHMIDEQHKRLFEMIANFQAALRNKENRRAMSTLLKGLSDYSSYHFHSEESMLELHGYPGYHQHKTIHDAFIKKIEEFRNRYEAGKLLLPIEIADFLKDWLSNHILVTDKQYAPFLHEKGEK